MLLETGDPDRALLRYRAAIALAPSSSIAHNNSGNAYRELARFDEALQAYRHALALDASNVEAHNNLGNMLKDRGDAQAAMAAFRRALDLAPNRPDIWSNMLLAMNGWDGASANAIAAEHRRYGAHFSRLLRPGAPVFPAKPGEGRLRIGYVSSDFRRHAVAAFLLPLVDSHDRQRFSVTCYDNGLQSDDVTERIRASVDRYRNIVGVSDRAVADLVHNDGIDILVDLNGHTARNRLPLFFLRPARVQVTWLGYLCTTGMNEIDYRLCDAYSDPRGTTEDLHTETLWRLPDTLWCYRPHAEAPTIGPSPFARNGCITFACLNNPAKVSPSALAAWAHILNRVAASRLLLMTASHPDRREDIARFFESHGVGRDRIEQIGRLSLGDYLSVYERVDVALDSFPYSGGTTSCDALWMGVPVVTLAGDRAFARSGVTVLNNVGVPEWIADTVEAYVQIATGLAENRDDLVRWRQDLRPRMKASRLLDGARFARDVEAAFQAMAAKATAGESGPG
jgi:protein O-GlcNAc transferase